MLSMTDIKAIVANFCDEDKSGEGAAALKYQASLATHVNVCIIEAILPNGEKVSMPFMQHTTTALVADTVQDFFNEACTATYAKGLTVRGVIFDGAIEHRNWMKWAATLSLRDIIADIKTRWKDVDPEIQAEWLGYIENVVKNIPKDKLDTGFKVPTELLDVKIGFRHPFDRDVIILANFDDAHGLKKFNGSKNQSDSHPLALPHKEPPKKKAEASKKRKAAAEPNADADAATAAAGAGEDDDDQDDDEPGQEELAYRREVDRRYGYGLGREKEGVGLGEGDAPWTDAAPSPSASSSAGPVKMDVEAVVDASVVGAGGDLAASTAGAAAAAAAASSTDGPKKKKRKGDGASLEEFRCIYCGLSNKTNSKGFITQRAHKWMFCPEVYEHLAAKKLKSREDWAGKSSIYFDKLVPEDWTPAQGLPTAPPCLNPTVKPAPGKRVVRWAMNEFKGASPMEQLYDISYDSLQQAWLEASSTDRFEKEHGRDSGMTFFSHLKKGHFEQTPRSSMNVLMSAQKLSNSSASLMKQKLGDHPSEASKQQLVANIQSTKEINGWFDVTNGKPRQYYKTGQPRPDDPDDPPGVKQAFEDAIYVTYKTPVLGDLVHFLSFLVEGQMRMKTWIQNNKYPGGLTQVGIAL